MDFVCAVWNHRSTDHLYESHYLRDFSKHCFLIFGFDFSEYRNVVTIVEVTFNVAEFFHLKSLSLLLGFIFQFTTRVVITIYARIVPFVFTRISSMICVMMFPNGGRESCAFPQIDIRRNYFIIEEVLAFVAR